MSNPLIQTAEKIDSVKKKAKKTVRGWKFKLVAILMGILLSLVAIDFVIKTVTDFTNTHKIIRQPILKIKIQWPYRIEPHTKQKAETSTEGAVKARILSPTPIVSTTLESFKKYLTDSGNKNREKSLIYLKKYYIGDELIAIDNLLKKEAGYRTDAVNSDSGACGIGQAYPCSKMDCPLTDEGLECQLQWVIGYINNRYGSPLVAWNFHLENNSY